jgi:ATP-dependent helicase/nuclease subunit B
MTQSRILHLYEIMEQNPMDRKVVLAATHAQGQQWLEQVSRRHGPVLNTEIRTFESWALERSKLLLTKLGLRFITPAESQWLVCGLLQELGETGYLNGITRTPGVTEAFHQALLELRGAGVKSEDLLSEDFEQRAKGEFVKKLLARYEQQLQVKQLTDLAGLLPYAHRLPRSADIIITDEFAVRTHVERTLLETLTGGVIVTLLREPGFTEPDSLFPVGYTEFFHANGTVAEIREIIRRISDHKLHWDQVEIIASDYGKHASAVFTAAQANGIMCTYAEGLPIGITNAGKAAKLFLDWLDSGFLLDPMLSGLKQGIIRFKGELLPDTPSSRIIRELEQSGIGWGRERYQILDKLSKAEGLAEERASALRTTHQIFQGIFASLTEECLGSPSRLAHVLRCFVETYAVMKEEHDYQVLNRLKAMEETMRIGGDFIMKESLVTRYVRENLDGATVGAAPTPAPGAIHVSSVNAGGLTGRTHTFIMGMTESNWSGSLRQDPVLLDEERIRINPRLRLSSEQAQRRVEERNGRIGLIRGRCTMSYCSHDLSDQKEHMPAYELLQIFRRNSGERDADYDRLHRSMDEAVRFFRSSSGHTGSMAMDAVEVWMSTLVAGHARLLAVQEPVYQAYPSLRAGANAAGARIGAELTPFDGVVETDLHPAAIPGDADSGAAFSASRLELYGRCPMSFFFQEVLGVRVKERAEYDRSRWLDALQRGSLLHDIFNRYLLGMKERRFMEGSHAPHDVHLLHRITEEVIGQYAEEVPAPSEHIFRKEAESIRKDAAIFYAGEQHRASIPVFTELQLHEDESPFLLELSGELSMPIRGYVDRVDEVAPHCYQIFDYKTGNPRKYKQNECFSGGTQLQLAMYGLAVEQWMKRTGYDSEAEVTDSSYVFPTERGMGEEVSRPQNQREELSGLLQAMTDAMKEGLFPPTRDPKGCAWCDYRAVCGSHAEAFSAKRSDPVNRERLGRLLEVERFA